MSSAKEFTNISPEADIMISDGWSTGIKLHPDYGQWADENDGWNVAGKGAKYNINNQTTSNQTLKKLYPYNSNYRYFGYQGNDRYNSLFSDRNIAFMSQMITKGLEGIHPENKNIIVPDITIRSVADSIFQSSFSNADIMTKMVINFIINHIKNEYQTIQQNNKLSIWVTKYDTNSGLQRFNGIKLNDTMRSHFSTVRY